MITMSKRAVSFSYMGSFVREWKSKDGLLNRINGPALEYDCGTKGWYYQGKFRRQDNGSRKGMFPELKHE